MKGVRILVGVILPLAIATSAFAQTPVQNIPTRSTSFRFVQLPAGIANNVSWIHAELPFPTVDQEEQVIRTGGDLNWTSGSPLALIAGGVQDRPWLAGYNSGAVDTSLQFSTCDSGQEVVTYTEALNDHFTWMLVPNWAVQSNAITITLSTGDYSEGPTGDSWTITSSGLMSAPVVNTKALLLDSKMDNQVSMVSSCLGDVYDEVGNMGAWVLGNKNGPTVRGVTLYNKQNYYAPFEVPQCIEKGKEWANDLHKLIAIIKVNQLIRAHNWEQLTEMENDDLQHPGKTSQIFWINYTSRVYQPIVIRGQ